MILPGSLIGCVKMEARVGSWRHDWGAGTDQQKNCPAEPMDPQRWERSQGSLFDTSKFWGGLMPRYTYPTQSLTIKIGRAHTILFCWVVLVYYNLFSFVLPCGLWRSHLELEKRTCAKSKVYVSCFLEEVALL